MSIARNCNLWITSIYEAEWVWVPRLTVGLYLITRVLQAKRVLIPNNCCANVVYAVILAGAEPVFCEVNLVNGGLDIRECEALLKATQIDIVVQVHAYGIYYNDREKINDLCKLHNAFIFEDGAVWFPHTANYEILENSCLGLSFGKSKIFDFGAGGICGFNDYNLAKEIEHLIHYLPLQPEAKSNYAQFYESFSERKKFSKSKDKSFVFFAQKYRSYWIGKCDFKNIQINEVETLRELDRRNQLVAAYKRALQSWKVQFFNSHNLDMPWRFSFLFKQASSLAEILRFQGFTVSHLYPSLDVLFPEFPKSAKLSNSYRLAEEVCNLSLDRNIKLENIEMLEKFLHKETLKSFVFKQNFKYLKMKLKSFFRR